MEAIDNAQIVPLPPSPPADGSHTQAQLGDEPTVSGLHVREGRQHLEDHRIAGFEHRKEKTEGEISAKEEVSEEEERQGNFQSGVGTLGHDILAEVSIRREANGHPGHENIIQRETSTTPPTPPDKPVPGLIEETATHLRIGDEFLPETSIASSSSKPMAHKRSLTISKGNTLSVVLISSALETIASSKEAKRSASLRDSTQRALEMIRANQGGDRPREIFEPLRLACETRSEKLLIASLDCISKLISYSFFVEEEAHPPQKTPSPPSSPHHPGQNPVADVSQSSTSQPSLVDLVAHTITSCHTENTPETVSLQIVKALLSLVLSSTILVHHSSLLKAVRTVYNVFLLSTDPVNQMVAQGGLTQMVHHVFTRCRTGRTSNDFNGPAFSPGVQDSTSPSGRISFAMPPPEPEVSFGNDNGGGHIHIPNSEGFSSRASFSLPPNENESHEYTRESQAQVTLYVTSILELS